MLERQLLTADYIYNGLGKPRENAAVVVQTTQQGQQIVAVDELELCLQNFSGAVLAHLGFALSIPPVNAHTHLDLSDLSYTPGSYPEFIQAVVAQRGRRGLAAAKRGLVKLNETGVSTVGDIVAREDVMRWLLTESGLKGVAYWEVIGPDPADAKQIFDATVAKLREFRALERPGGMRVGLAPHTPHTLSPELLQKLASLAQHNGIPMQIHVAESDAETELYVNNSGPLKHPHWRVRSKTPVQYLEDLGVLDAGPTLVHMVHVGEDDVRAVQRAGCTVVHCPRSNSALESGRFPWELYAKHGVSVALGTDSLGSSPDLSLPNETHAALKLHGVRVSAASLIWSATKGGYRALGLKPPHFARGSSPEALYAWPDAP